MERKIKQQVRGFRTQDGAGVSLVRVLGNVSSGYVPLDRARGDSLLAVQKGIESPRTVFDTII